MICIFFISEKQESHSNCGETGNQFAYDHRPNHIRALGEGEGHMPCENKACGNGKGAVQMMPRLSISSIISKVAILVATVETKPIAEVSLIPSILPIFCSAFFRTLERQ